MLKKWLEKWRSYRYRFVPWIALNWKNRTVREVRTSEQDKTIPDAKIIETLSTVLKALQENDVTSPSSNQSEEKPTCTSVMYNTLGYQVERCTSTIREAGRGVFVTCGKVPPGNLVALYPGTIYWPYEPILIQSIGNPFIFRCIDGILVDGNDKGLSKIIYRSNARRDQIGPYSPCDMTWLESTLENPLSVGQYVNNRTRNIPANVAYQEVDIPFGRLPLHLWKYLPNIWYSSGNIVGDHSFLRTVALVSVAEINEGEELFSSYYTVVH